MLQDVNPPVSVARYFSNTNSIYLEIADNAIWDASDSLTVSIWIRPENWSNYKGVFSRWHENSGSRTWAIVYDSGSLRFDTSSDGGFNGANTASTTAPATDRWLHLVCVHDPVNAYNTIYYNGILQARRTGVATTLFDSARPVQIGGVSEFGGGGQFSTNGWLAHAALWAAVLTENEIIQLTMGANPLQIRGSQSLGFWPLNDAPNSRDYSFNNNVATVQGGNAPLVNVQGIGGLYTPTTYLPLAGPPPVNYYGPETHYIKAFDLEQSPNISRKIVPFTPADPPPINYEGPEINYAQAFDLEQKPNKSRSIKPSTPADDQPPHLIKPTKGAAFSYDQKSITPGRYGPRLIPPPLPIPSRTKITGYIPVDLPTKDLPTRYYPNSPLGKIEIDAYLINEPRRFSILAISMPGSPSPSSAARFTLLEKSRRYSLLDSRTARL